MTADPTTDPFEAAWASARTGSPPPTPDGFDAAWDLARKPATPPVNPQVNSAPTSLQFAPGTAGGETPWGTQTLEDDTPAAGPMPTSGERFEPGVPNVPGTSPGERNKTAARERVDAAQAAAGQGTPTAIAAEHGGTLGRIRAVATTGWDAAWQQAKANLAGMLGGELPPPTRSQDQEGDELIAEHASAAEQVIGGLPAMIPGFADPKVIAAMALAKAPSGATMASPYTNAVLGAVGRRFGPKAQAATQALLGHAVGGGTFGAFHAQLNNRTIGETAEEAAFTGALGVGFGLPGIPKALRGSEKAARAAQGHAAMADVREAAGRGTATGQPENGLAALTDTLDPHTRNELAQRVAADPTIEPAAKEPLLGEITGSAGTTPPPSLEAIPGDAAVGGPGGTTALPKPRVEPGELEAMPTMLEEQGQRGQPDGQAAQRPRDGAEGQPIPAEQRGTDAQGEGRQEQQQLDDHGAPPGGEPTTPRGTFLAKASEAFGAEHAEATMPIIDAYARTWAAAEPGRTTQQFFERYDIQKGGQAEEGALLQRTYKLPIDGSKGGPSEIRVHENPTVAEAKALLKRNPTGLRWLYDRASNRALWWNAAEATHDMVRRSAGFEKKDTVGQELQREAQITDATLANPGYNPFNRTGGKDGPTLFQAKPDAMGFYSQAEHAVSEFKDPKGKMTGAQWHNWLKNQPGVKPEELDYIGIKDVPDKMTREEAAAWIGAHRVELKETVKGGAEKYSNNEEGLENLVTDAANDRALWNRVFGGRIEREGGRGASRTSWGAFDTAEERVNHIYNTSAVDQATYYLTNGQHADLKNATQFSEYQTPGGSNYRELLLQMPKRERGPVTQDNFHDFATAKGLTPEQIQKAWRDQNNETYQEWYDQRFGERDRHDFTGGHFDEPNVLAHIRFNDRTGPDGKRTLFVEEIQSDWHQKGRKQGYRPRDQRAAQARMAEIDREITTIGRQVDTAARILSRYSTESDIAGDLLEPTMRALDEPSRGPKIPTPDVSGAPEAWAGTVVEQIRRINEWKAQELRLKEEWKGLNSGIPDVPFKTTWQTLALKRIMKYAADHGYDRVAWTTGEMQAERYDLSKQVTHIEWNANVPNLEGDRFVNINTIRGPLSIELKGTKVLKARNAAAGDLVGKELDDVIGKEVAKKILESTKGRLEGEGLKVGGDGMRGFYDKILPAEANRIAKKWGGKVERTPLHQPDASVHIPADWRAERMDAATAHAMGGQPNDWIVIDSSTNIELGIAPGMVSERQALVQIVQSAEDAGTAADFGARSARIARTDNIHSLDITPAAREHLTRGQPLFQNKGGTPQGSYKLMEGGKAVIRALTDPNASTLPHEVWHSFLDLLPEIDPKLAREARKALGAGPEQPLSVEQHEKWARAGEAYLRTGKAPSPALARAFAAFKRWLVQLYRTLKGSPLEGQMNPKLRALFDEMLTRGDKPKEATDALSPDAQRPDRLNPAGPEAQGQAQQRPTVQEGTQTGRDAPAGPAQPGAAGSSSVRQPGDEAIPAGRPLTDRTPTVPHADARGQEREVPPEQQRGAAPEPVAERGRGPTPAAEPPEATPDAPGPTETGLKPRAPRRSASGLEYSKADLERRLTDAHEATGLAGGVELNEADAEAAGGDALGTTFLHKLPPEIAEEVKGDPSLRRMFHIIKHTDEGRTLDGRPIPTGPGSPNADGPDSMNIAGGFDEYMRRVREMAGGKAGKVREAKAFAHGLEQMDPATKLMAVLHDTLAPDPKDRPKQAVIDQPERIPTGSTLSINGERYTIGMDGDEPVLIGDAVTTYLRALESLPYDKGSLRGPGEQKRPEIADTPETDTAPPEQAPPQGPTTTTPPADNPGNGLFDNAQPGPYTGIRNAASEVIRLREGWGERVLPNPRGHEQMYAKGMAAAAADPMATTRILEELRRDPERILSSDDEVALAHKHRVDQENELHRLLKTADEAKAGGDAQTERIARLQLLAHREAIHETTELLERTGTAAGRALEARKLMSDLNHSLVHMEAMATAAKGSPLTEPELAKVRALHEELKVKLAAAEEALAGARERAAKAQAAEHHERLLREAAEKKVPAYIRDLAARFKRKIDQRAAASEEFLRAQGVTLNIGIDPTKLPHYINIGAKLLTDLPGDLSTAAAKLAEWTRLAIEKFGEAIKPDLAELYEESKKRHDQDLAQEARVVQKAQRKTRELTPVSKKAAPERTTIQKITDRAKEGKPYSELGPYLNNLALEMIREGTTKREPLLDRLHEAVKPAYPEITREQTRDTLSGYGDFRPLDKEAAKTRLREIKGESQKLAQLEALLRKEAPLATGMERQAPSEETRHLTKQVNEAKKAAGISASREGQLKSALEALKTRTRNTIKDLQTELDTGQRIVKGKPIRLSDPELDALRAQLETLRDIHDKAFPPRRPDRTPEQTRSLIEELATLEAHLKAGTVPEKALRPAAPAAAVQALREQRDTLKAQVMRADPAKRTAIQEQIATLEAHLKAGTVPASPAPRPPAPADIQTLRDRRNALREQLRPPISDEKRLALATAAAERSAKAWADRLARAQKGDFSTTGKRTPTTGPELDTLRAQSKAAREQYLELKSLDPAQKALAETASNQSYRARLAEREADLLDRLTKGDYTRRPPRKTLTLDNQSALAQARVEATKQKFRQLQERHEKAQRPLPRRAAEAYVKWVRFGALSWPTVLEKLTGAAIARTLTTPMEQAVGLALSKVMPRLAAKAPREGVRSTGAAIRAEAAALARMWTDGMKGSAQMLANRRTTLELLHGKDKLPPEITDWSGRLHGALKNPVKEAEYARSLTLRIEHAIRNGIDPTEPIHQMRLATEAYQDANRAIFMQKNKVADAWRRGLAALEAPDKETGKQTAASYLASILRGELPVVSVPMNVIHEASQILTGWMTGPARAAFAYARGIEKLKPTEADAIMRLMKKGSIGAAMLALGFFNPDLVGGYYQQGEKRKPGEPQAGDIGPVHHRLLHNPYAEVVQFGATIRRVADAKFLKKQQDHNGLLSGLTAAAFGMLAETPFLRETTFVGKLMDPRQRENALASTLRSKMIPGVITWSAKLGGYDFTTRDTANRIERELLKIDGEPEARAKARLDALLAAIKDLPPEDQAEIRQRILRDRKVLTAPTAPR